MAWQFDMNHTRAGWSVRHYGINVIHGHFRRIEAALDFTGDDPAQWSVEATIDATSVDSCCEPRDKHLRSADYLDVEQYPTITFKSARVEPANGHYRVVGDLTVHGVTREVALDGQFRGQVNDDHGQQRRGFSATTTVRRTDFGVGVPAGKPSSVADELQLTIDTEAIDR